MDGKKKICVNGTSDIRLNEDDVVENFVQVCELICLPSFFKRGPFQAFKHFCDTAPSAEVTTDKAGSPPLDSSRADLFLDVCGLHATLPYSRCGLTKIVGLKAELFRKQEEFKRDRLQNGNSSGRPKPANKKASIWSKKNAGVQSRDDKDKQLTSEEEDALAKSQSILAAKAKLYEKMMGGDIISDESTNERFLVDFEKKAVDKILTDKGKKDEDGEAVMATVPTREEMMGTKSQEDEDVDDSDIPPPASADEEWVDYVDTLGRSRRCLRKDLPRLINMDKNLNPDKFREEEKKEKLGTESLPDLLSEDMYREMLRKKWETEEEEAAKKGSGPVHYQNVKFDEVRDMGVGYFDFSKDETERQQQMDSLQMLRDETVDQRARRNQLKAKRKAALQARLAKVKQRKKLKGDLPSLGDEEKEEGDKDVARKKEETKEGRLADKSYEMLMGRTKKEQPVREWDIGKDPSIDPKLWEEAKKKARDERLSEFAPPSAYDASNHHHKHSSNRKPSGDKQSQNANSKSKQATSSTTTEFKDSYYDSLKSAEFTFVPSSGGFQAFQKSKKKTAPHEAFETNQATSSEERLARPPSSAGHSKIDEPSDSRTFVNEDTINQNLAFFRKQTK